MRLRFIGQDGSMGLKFGQIYRVNTQAWQNGIRITAPVTCPYSSDEAFWRNWAHPREDLRELMEARGRALRELHVVREYEQIAQKNSDAPMEEGMLEEQRTGEDK